jgi:hypothetical protein
MAYPPDEYDHPKSEQHACAFETPPQNLLLSKSTIVYWAHDAPA